MRSDVSVAPPCTDLSLEKWENAFQRKKDEHATLGTSFVAASFPVREVSFAVHSTDPSQCATIKRATLRLAQDLSLGVGGCLWDCGIRIAQFLGEHIGIVADRRVLELGSGTGVAGLAAASCGAAIVVLTDLPELISLLEQNVTANGLAATAVVCSYAWGSLVDTRCAGSDASSDSAHEKHLSGSAAFDVVICCDCSYCCNEVAASEDLLAALLRFVAGDTLLLLAHKRRGDDAELALFQRLDEHFLLFNVASNAAAPAATAGSAEALYAEGETAQAVPAADPGPELTQGQDGRGKARGGGSGGGGGGGKLAEAVQEAAVAAAAAAQKEDDVLVMIGWRKRDDESTV